MSFDSNIQNRIDQWLNGDYDEDSKKTIKENIAKNPSEIADAFYCDLDFGTGGLRGIMGIGPNRMNKYTVGNATQGLANYILSFGNDNKSVAIAYDCRNNSKYFAHIAADVLSANGIKVYLFDELRPTPELSFAVRELKCDAGIVITASHNPKEYNGYKVYWNDGGQLVPPHDKNTIASVRKIQNVSNIKFQANEKLIEYIGKDIDDKYIKALLQVRLSENDIKKQENLKIVYTPLHGTGVNLLPKALQMFGFKNIIHVPEQDVNDGNFPTVFSPNPEEKTAMEMAIKKAEETTADIILATDPDADRVGVGVRNSEGNYILLNGNQTASLLAYYTLNQRQKIGNIPSNAFMVKTIVTTDLFSDIAKSFNVNVYEVLTGFKYIANKILEKEKKEKYIGGGEESYGYLGADFVRDKDALMTSCQIAEIAAWAKNNNKNLCSILSDIYSKYGYYQESLISITKKGIQGKAEINTMMEKFKNNPPEKIGNLTVSVLNNYNESISTNIASGIKTSIDLPKSNVLQFILSDKSKITIRPSGTEPKIKFYFSIYSKEYNENSIKEIKDKETIFQNFFTKQ